MTALLRAVNITKSYHIDSVETQVLNGIDFAIEPQSLLAIMGSSGAGKSTFLHVISSLDPPTSGQVLFDDTDLYERDDEELSEFRNQTMGFVFQFHHLLPEFNAIENVMMPLLIRKVSQREARKKALVLLERLGLGGRADHRPAELSGGEQQRVAVARALIGRPRIVFADEPTGNLDQENGEKLIDLLLELHREEKMALVLVTHNPSLTARFPQKIRLADGRLEGLAA